MSTAKAVPTHLWTMHTLGMVVSLCAFLLAGLIVWRGSVDNSLKLFPLFYSYLTYAVCGSLVMYLVYWLDPRVYSSAYWVYFLITILAEFAVLVEISDHVFQRFPAIRHLGRAITVFIIVVLGLFYILPTILWSSDKRSMLVFNFSLRASVTKAVILGSLLIIAQHYSLVLGKSVKGLMLGFSTYLGVNVGNLAAARAFGRGLYGGIFWTMVPLAYTLCLLIWAVALWHPATDPVMRPLLPEPGGEPDAMIYQLGRFNNLLSDLLRR